MKRANFSQNIKQKNKKIISVATVDRNLILEARWRDKRTKLELKKKA